jgi:hypothetical protein
MRYMKRLAQQQYTPGFVQERRETQNAHTTTGLEQVRLTGYGNRHVTSLSRQFDLS